MRRNLGRTWLLCGVLALAGCGDDGNGGDGGITDDGGSMTDTGNGGGGDGGSGTMCSSMEQDTMLNTCFPDTGMGSMTMDRDIVRLANYCGGEECLTPLVMTVGGTEEDQENARMCVNDCIQANTSDLRSQCTNCFARAAVCVGMNCTAECMTDPSAKQCLECQCENGCQMLGSDCAGLASPVCPVEDCTSDADCTEMNKGVCHENGYCRRASPCGN